MDTAALGRTGLNVSVAGLGGGGPSRLGLRDDRNTPDQAVALVRRAIDRGVTLIDTASGYGTEPIVGRAVREFIESGGDRDALVLSSKHPAKKLTRRQYLDKIDESLGETGLDRLDLYHVHGVGASDLPHVMDEVVPALKDARDAGKIGFLAISERFESEPAHDMAKRLFARDDWATAFDVMMVGFNLLNPSARRHVFPQTQKHGIGTLCMFAVRRALTDVGRRREVLAEMGHSADALDFLGEPPDVVAAGYRFCRHEPGVDCTLFGTGDLNHLDANLDALDSPPLPDADLARLADLFGESESASGS